MRNPASVYRSTGSPHRCTQCIGQLLNRGKTFCRFYATATGHDNFGFFQVHRLGHFLHAFQQVHANVGRINVDIFPHDFTGTAVVGHALFEHTGTHGAHLGPVVGAQDFRHQVTAKGRTGPGDIAGFFVNAQFGAVRRQTSANFGRHTGSHITAVIGSANEHGRGLVLIDQFRQRVGAGVGRILIIFVAFHQNGFVGAIRNGFFRHIFHLAADDHSDQLFAQFVGQLTARRQQFIAHILGRIFFGLDQNPQVLVVFKTHDVSPLSDQLGLAEQLD